MFKPSTIICGILCYAVNAVILVHAYRDNILGILSHSFGWAKDGLVLSVSISVDYVISNYVSMLSSLGEAFALICIVSLFIFFCYCYCKHKGIGLYPFVVMANLHYASLAISIGLVILKLLMFTVQGGMELFTLDITGDLFCVRYLDELDVETTHFMNISQIINQHGENGSTLPPTGFSGVGPTAPSEVPLSIERSTEIKLRAQCRENLRFINGQGTRCYDSITWPDSNLTLTRNERTCFTHALAGKDTEYMTINREGKAIYTWQSGFSGRVKSDTRLINIMYPDN